MSSRKFTGDRKNKSNFQETKADKSRSTEKKLSRPSDGFFIKPSSKNKKITVSDKTVNRTNNTITSQRDSIPKKDNEPHPAPDGEKVRTKTQLFDKKAWRFKRYSKKYKLDQWKDVRKTNVLRGFNKMTSGVSSTSFNFEEELNRAEIDTLQETSFVKVPSPLNDDESNPNNTEQKNTKPTKQHSFIYRNKLSKQNQDDEEVNTKKMESLKRKAAKEEAIKEYKRKKMEKFKKLSRKTKKGQPVMKDRIEVLLEEIQNSMRD